MRKESPAPTHSGRASFRYRLGLGLGLILALRRLDRSELVARWSRFADVDHATMLRFQAIAAHDERAACREQLLDMLGFLGADPHARPVGKQCAAQLTLRSEQR